MLFTHPRMFMEQVQKLMKCRRLNFNDFPIILPSIT